jgi:hypothetical protein
MGKCLSSIGKWALRRSNFPYWRGTPKVNVTATRPPMSVSASGTNLVSHAGSRLLAEVADRTGLTAALSEALAGRTAPQTAHDPGRVLVDLAVMIADGGTTISDIAALGHQQAVFGPVASDSTCWRVLDAITESDLVALGAARARAREVSWLGRAELTGTALPPIRVAGVDLRDRTGRAVLVIDLDATIVIAHSEKEQARPTFKGSFGYHPLLAFCDNTHEALAGLLRPGNAGSNTATDHLQVLDAALAQIPQQFRHGHPILIRADGAGSTRALLEHITGLGKSLIAAEFSVGWAITERERTAIKALPARFWTPAIDSTGDLRDGADVAELTGLLPAALLATYPAGMRVIVRRERPHPGAQLDLFETRDGYRYTAFATTTALGQHAWLDARHRSHARVEDRIRCGKDTGIGRFPSREFAINQAWLLCALTAIDLLAWTQTTLLHDHPTLAVAEPKTLRYRLLHVAARLTRSARYTHLRIDRTWPWAAVLVTAFHRLRSLPQPAY